MQHTHAAQNSPNLKKQNLFGFLISSTGRTGQPGKTQKQKHSWTAVFFAGSGSVSGQRFIAHSLELDGTAALIASRFLDARCQSDCSTEYAVSVCLSQGHGSFEQRVTMCFVRCFGASAWLCCWCTHCTTHFAVLRCAMLCCFDAAPRRCGADRTTERQTDDRRQTTRSNDIESTMTT